jgi:hypothetical protein
MNLEDIHRTMCKCKPSRSINIAIEHEMRSSVGCRMSSPIEFYKMMHKRTYLQAVAHAMPKLLVHVHTN